MPRFARVPGCGDCAITVPGGSDEATCFSVGARPRACNAFTASAAPSPVTSGIPTPGGPFDTTSFTAVPCATELPSCGDWSTTIPFGFVAALRTTFDRSFAWLSWNSAAWKRIPVTFGTVVFDATTTAAGFDES